jgi:nicotinamide mononucleotide transporter
MTDFFFNIYQSTPFWIIALEFLAFTTGILSVWFAKNEKIIAYPIGLIGTSITVFLLYKAHYFGDMLVNIYFSIMSIYGWLVWAGIFSKKQPIMVSRTNKQEKSICIVLFIVTICVIFAVYGLFDYALRIENYVDVLTAGIFFSAMWLMARKKIENWVLWIIGNSIAVPLYAYRSLGMLAIQYLIFTILAVKAFIAWKKIINNKFPTQLS